MNESGLYIYFILPSLIFLARVCDVSIGTIRIILVSKGYKRLAPLLGFLEVLIWVIAITEIIQNLNNWACYIGYAGGFAMGNYVGMLIEERLALGYELIRIITRKDSDNLVHALLERGYRITQIPAKGSTGDVGVIYSVIKRTDLKEFIAFMKKFNPKAFYTIEDIRFVNEPTQYMVKKSIIRKKPFRVKK